MPSDVQPRRFAPGWAGGPGRPKGSRSKLSETFLKLLAADFESEGMEVLRRVRVEDPSTYVRVIASLVPKELGLTGADGGPIEGVLKVEFVRPGE